MKYNSGNKKAKEVARKCMGITGCDYITNLSTKEMKMRNKYRKSNVERENLQSSC